MTAVELKDWMKIGDEAVDLMRRYLRVGFTDNWVFRRCGLHAYGFGPFVLDEGEWGRIHGNDERISVENLTAGVRCYTEMLLDMAAA